MDPRDVNPYDLNSVAQADRELKSTRIGGSHRRPHRSLAKAEARAEAAEKRVAELERWVTEYDEHSAKVRKQLAEAQGRIEELEMLVVMVQKNLNGVQQDALAAMDTQVALHIAMVLKELREAPDGKS